MPEQSHSTRFSCVSRCSLRIPHSIARCCPSRPNYPHIPLNLTPAMSKPAAFRSQSSDECSKCISDPDRRYGIRQSAHSAAPSMPTADGWRNGLRYNNFHTALCSQPAQLLTGHNHHMITSAPSRRRHWVPGQTGVRQQCRAVNRDAAPERLALPPLANITKLQHGGQSVRPSRPLARSGYHQVLWLYRW